MLPLLYLSSIRLISAILIPIDFSSLWINKTFTSPFNIQHATLKILSKLDPFNADYKHILAWNLWSVDLSKADKAIKSAINRSVIDPKSWIFLGWIKGREGFITEGYKDFDRAVMLNPKRPDSLAQQGLYVYQMLPLIDKSVKPLFQVLAELNLRVAMELDPVFARYPPYAFALAMIYQEKGDSSAASSVLRNINTDGPTDWQLTIRNMVLYLQLNRYLTAIAQWETSFNPDKLTPAQINLIEKELNKYNIPDLRYFLARIYLHQGKTDVALGELKSLVALRGNVVEYRLALGDMYEKAGNRKDALIQYEKAVELSPANQQAKKKVIEYYSKR
ncbi:MAG: tetratricopeptide repeat protein [Proteobacteria bacterium]|nr:tetratricopeptide repeat protein [Pseudomonadota bacterium]